jgi:hypothetical protein
MNGEIVCQGAYPRREDLAQLTGLIATVSQTKPRIRLNTTGGCTPGSSCC